MLKVEYPCRDILSSYQNPTKSNITWVEAKKHLHDVRLRRQQQLTSNINECHKLQTIHKQVFNQQFNSTPIEKSSNDKAINYDCSFQAKKYSIPRIEYASMLYRQAIPTFEIETTTNIPIVKELSQYLSESSRAISENNRSVSSRNRNHQRRLSVSSVASVDKRANKVYEKWPDYNQISEIVGYRIEPPPPKIITSNSSSSRPSGAVGQRKRTTKSGFPTASKQIKSIITLNPSSKTKKPPKTSDSTPIILDKPSVTIEKVPIHNPIQQMKPKLPNILCPSSITYSNHIQTRQWLMKNNFSLNALRTLPLL